jgi:hypothetical protein
MILLGGLLALLLDHVLAMRHASMTRLRFGTRRFKQRRFFGEVYVIQAVTPLLATL